MKRFLALCLMTCLSLPALSGPALLTVGLAGVAMVATPSLAHAEVVAEDSDGAEHLAADGELHEGDDAHGERAKTPILSFDFGSAFWNLVVFVCVLAVLSIFVWPSVLGGLQSREDKIREDLELAEKANAEAQAILAGYQAKLDEAAKQTHAMLAEARRDAEASGQRIVEQAKAEAATQRERAVADIENAKKVAMADIATRTSDMAMQVARGVVGRELTPNDHADLIAQAMQRLPSNN
ncbi:F0F1 ATP synthase subunit B family protein [Allorhodopirellula heiligendammensis]|uniref:ATP synthase subunit b n=1 Tax=Allorhodopirellula heiligendammensis TaxID=2714739 RepID=A0A5C6C6D4_9BACT|nr:ATP synthase F0 subunit B [Allorhodopirellula heiligendammensis]TWU19612.1 ATP synthase subunit b precursor [Allorhodopirellula heiligendammensis]